MAKKNALSFFSFSGSSSFFFFWWQRVRWLGWELIRFFSNQMSRLGGSLVEAVFSSFSRNTMFFVAGANGLFILLGEGACDGPGYFCEDMLGSFR